MRSVAAAFVRPFAPGGPVKAFNLHAIQRLAADVAAVERFADGAGVPNLMEGLAEPRELCALLLSDTLSDVLYPDVRRQKYPSLELPLVAAVLDRYKEAPTESRWAARLMGGAAPPPPPPFPPKKTVEALNKQLRMQMVIGSGPKVLQLDDM